MRHLLLVLVLVLQIHNAAGYNVPVLPKTCVEKTLTSENSDNSACSCIVRGFTGHQHLDVFNLINMNGRVYDPVVQQFLSPDPYVQMPDNPLNYNRYSYALNNPLHWTDPTGEMVIRKIGDDAIIEDGDINWFISDFEDDWVKRHFGAIEWDEDAISEETTKKGDKYIGKTVLAIDSEGKTIYGDEFGKWHDYVR